MSIKSIMMASMHQLSLLDSTEKRAAWRVRESRRARRLSLRVYRDGAVEVVAPPRTTPRLIESFVARHRDWIERKQRHATLRPPEAFPPATLNLAAFGEQWQCVVEPAALRGVRIREPSPGVLCLRAPADASAQSLQRSLRDWLGRRAATGFEGWLREVALGMGLQFQQLQIRWQRSRWGSCSSRGTISLNGALLFQPPALVRYLMVHELSHLKHMNHSARFWALVEQHEPDWRRLDRELLAGWVHVPSWLHGPGGGAGMGY
ncbi:MAG: SprT family zinc-dependent metalloprotease [Steroidobacteraceae bacterium]